MSRSLPQGHKHRGERWLKNSRNEGPILSLTSPIGGQTASHFLVNVCGLDGNQDDEDVRQSCVGLHPAQVRQHHIQHQIRAPFARRLEALLAG
jgi:hypothetical protein